MTSRIVDTTEEAAAAPRAAAPASIAAPSEGTRTYAAVEGILGLRTNSDYVGWSWGTAPECSTPAYEACRVRVRLTVDPLETFPPVDELEKYHYWRGRPRDRCMYYQRSLIGQRPLRMIVRGLLDDEPELVVNPDYLRYVRFRFNNLFSPGYHLTDLVCARLLQQALSPLHCSAFAVGDKTIVVVAPPDSGKTLTTMQAVMKGGADFLSEDVAITDGEQLFACPWTSTFRYYDSLTESRLHKAWMRLVRTVPVFELLRPPSGVTSITDYVPAERIRSRGRITHVAILARRPGGVVELEAAQAHRLVANLNRYEFAYMKNPMLVAASYFDGRLDLDALVERERAILARMVGGARCLLVQSADPTTFADQILSSL